MKTIKLSLIVLFLFAAFGILNAQKITILHTNDIHSRINGDGPQADYTPLIVDNGSGVLGGFARLATLLKQQKAKNPDGTLTIRTSQDLRDKAFFLEAVNRSNSSQKLNISFTKNDMTYNGLYYELRTSDLNPDLGCAKDANNFTLIYDNKTKSYLYFKQRCNDLPTE